MTKEGAVFQKYPAYKDSGVEWIGESPEGWHICKLRILGTFSASGIDKYFKKNESKVKIINFTDIYSNKKRILDSKREYMIVTTPEQNRMKHLVKKGDLIFLPSSETYEDLGTSALVNENLENTSFSYHVIRFVFKKNVEHSFKKYLTNNSFVLEQFARAGKGTTRKIIGRNVFQNILVLLPPIQEQIYISNFLDEKCCKIDLAVAQKEKMVELLKERRQIMIQTAVTKGLDPTAKMKDSGVEWIGEIPEGWEVKRLKLVFQEINERTKTGEEILLSLRMVQGLIPHDEVSGKPIPDNSLIDYKIIHPGQLVMNRMRAAIGIFGIATRLGLVSPDYAVFKNRINVNVDYFLLLFKTSMMGTQFRLNSKGLGTGSSGFMRLYSENFGNIKIPFPSVDHQKKILDYIDKESCKIDKAITLQQKQIEKLKEYKATLINSAVTGKIKVV